MTQHWTLNHVLYASIPTLKVPLAVYFIPTWSWTLTFWHKIWCITGMGQNHNASGHTMWGGDVEVLKLNVQVLCTHEECCTTAKIVPYMDIHRWAVMDTKLNETQRAIWQTNLKTLVVALNSQKHRQPSPPVDAKYWVLPRTCGQNYSRITTTNYWQK